MLGLDTSLRESKLENMFHNIQAGKCEPSLDNQLQEGGSAAGSYGLWSQWFVLSKKRMAPQVEDDWLIPVMDQ